MTRQYYTYFYLTAKGHENVFCAVSDKTALTYLQEDNEEFPDDPIVKITNTYTKEVIYKVEK
jgi:hypothetical protein